MRRCCRWICLHDVIYLRRRHGVSFASLLQKFALLFDDYTPFNTSHILLKQDPSKGGLPRKVRPEDCLGLVLVWTRTRGSLLAQLIFGMTCSNLCMYLSFGRRVIVEALKSDSLPKIAIPCRWRDEPAPIRCVVHNGWAQAVLAAVGKYQDRLDAWSLCDTGLCFLPLRDHSHCLF